MGQRKRDLPRSVHGLEPTYEGLKCFPKDDILHGAPPVWSLPMRD